MPENLRLTLKSFDSKSLYRAAKELLKIAKILGIKIKGPIPLPRDKKKFTVNRSPHIDKKSREQFELNTFKVLIICLECSAQFMNALRETPIPAGVDIGLKIELKKKNV